MENEHQITGKILVVDDLEENRMVLKSILEIHGYEIVEGVNGLEAVEKAQAENPDLILLDVNMPEMDGMTACRKIKKELKLDTIPVIFLTARREKDDLVKGFEAGAVDYLTKPFYPLELLARIKTHIELKLLRKSVEDTNQTLFGTNSQLLEQNQMLSNRIQMHARLQGMLTRSVPVELINLAKTHLVQGSQALPDEKVVRTFMFLDLAGFTAFSEAKSPSEVTDHVNRVFGPATQLIYQFQGDVNQFVRDSIFAVFPNSVEAVKCAVAIQKMIRDAGDGVFQVRIGIHSGPALRCRVGTDFRSQHSYMGSSVNLAEHLEEACNIGEIMVSKSVYDLVADEYNFAEPIALELRGTKNSIQGYALTPE